MICRTYRDSARQDSGTFNELKEAFLSLAGGNRPNFPSLPSKGFDHPGHREEKEVFVVDNKEYTIAQSGGQATQEVHVLEESLSLEKKEKELIIRALRKHTNNRKKAAKELGISERTLYRKLKTYDIV